MACTLKEKNRSRNLATFFEKNGILLKIRYSMPLFVNFLLEKKGLFKV
jgi:hypothetical protein